MAVIRVQGLSKKFAKNFRLGGKIATKRVLKAILGFADDGSILQSKEFWALKDISFEVKKGEALALVGRNGSGKSTLLKNIMGVHLPDQGTVTTIGHVEGLVELSAGFHPMLSGRDNLRQRCSLLGLSRSELDRLVDEMIDFSELGDFIDMPLKNYSSGMGARIGFASAVLSSPDILLIDEVLSVGDFEFKQKCLDRVNKIKKDTAVIFVSHSAQTMSMFCNRGIFLEKGRVLIDGNLDSVLKEYLKNSSASPRKRPEGPQEVMGEEFRKDEVVLDYSINYQNALGQNVVSFDGGDRKIYLDVNVKFKPGSLVEERELLIGVPIWNSEGFKITALNSDMKKIAIRLNDNGIKLRLEVENIFNSGTYYSCLALMMGPEYLLRRKLTPFSVSRLEAREQGVVTPEFAVEFGV